MVYDDDDVDYERMFIAWANNVLMMEIQQALTALQKYNTDIVAFYRLFGAYDETAPVTLLLFTVHYQLMNPCSLILWYYSSVY